jgi:hypothetical protein
LSHNRVVLKTPQPYIVDERTAGTRSTSAVAAQPKRQLFRSCELRAAIQSRVLFTMHDTVDYDCRNAVSRLTFSESLGTGRIRMLWQSCVRPVFRRRCVQQFCGEAREPRFQRRVSGWLLTTLSQSIREAL